MNQTYKNFELILIDNGSSDETMEVYNRYANNLNVSRIIPIHENIGLIRAANLALKSAKGRWIIRLDADDFFDYTAFEKLIKCSEGKDAVYSGFITFDNEYNLIKSYSPFDAVEHGACCLIRRSFLERIGGYDEDFDCCDGYFLNRKLKIDGGVIGYNAQQLFYYRQNPEGISSNLKKISETREKIEKKYRI